MPDPRNAIIRDLRAARPAFAGSELWALTCVTMRDGILRPEHCRIIAWAHLKARRGQTFRQTVVQRLARAREATLADLPRHLPGGDAA